MYPPLVSGLFNRINHITLVSELFDQMAPQLRRETFYPKGFVLNVPMGAVGNSIRACVSIG